jgi:soluble lytic murein transglycosylase-like protein
VRVREDAVSATHEPTARRVYEQWNGIATAVAALRKVDRFLTLAIIAQESAGDTTAWRPEPKFLTRYRDGIARSIEAVPDPDDRRRYARWLERDPMILACSMGLMQVLTIVAIERRVALAYPTSLCDPGVGIEAGCRQLRHCFDATADSDSPRTAALQRYNGGADPHYAAQVLAWSDMLQGISREVHP